ncbi:unnamed protein product [Lymnaea stagnalis]|uniref:BPTI/Kunitz inhibitor domain-containing protein n=1 Tax=Lymnaea stagnalis TaxID=6523 RepID=A0AAV2GY25_LYMST
MMTKMLVFCLFGMLCIQLSTQQTATCDLEKDAGPCRGIFKRFYFNKVTGACEEFEYGGCQGNANNFETSEDCLAACQAARKK